MKRKQWLRQTNALSHLNVRGQGLGLAEQKSVLSQSYPVNIQEFFLCHLTSFRALLQILI